MSNIDKRALREAAVRAGGVKWQYMRAKQHSKAYITDDKGSTVVNCTDGDVPAKCAGFLESANPATVLALLDELEAVEHQNGYLREQRDEWERKAVSNFEECVEMSARIEELESQRQMAFMAGNRWADKFREAEKRIAELAEALKQTVSGYKSCLRTGHDRILDLGGDCDAPEVMIAGNTDIQQAEKLLAAAAGNGE